MELKDLSELYRDKFLLAYSNLVALTVKNPKQILIEESNVLSHLFQSLNPHIGDGKRDENLQKAYNHLVRATLDSHKMVWAYLNEQLDVYVMDHQKRLCFNMSQADVLNAHRDFKKCVLEARRFEVKNIGNDPLGSIEYYDKANIVGFNLFDKLDVTKVEDLDKALKKYTRVFTAKNIVLGLITGSIVALISGLYFCGFWEEFIDIFRLLTKSISSFSSVPAE